MTAPGPLKDRWPERFFTVEPAKAAVCLDFDGTLAGIVDDPARSVPLGGVDEALAALAGRFGVVAVVSGRPASFLAERLPGAARSGVHLAGLYGLERIGGSGEVVADPAALGWEETMASLTVQANNDAPAGVHVEPKRLTLALHWRRAEDHGASEAWAQAFATDAADRHGVLAHGGRMSLEIRPPVEVDKGSVVETLCANSQAVCYIGDDIGDLAAFAALERLSATGVVAVKVAVASHEAPADLLARADIVVPGPPGVLRLLAALLD